ncbi:biotin--[acetyl-CoA-carboxylase] ligase [Taibaiella lutea]|uniref:Biotin--[acetyl-CoA-carboxylase] ligase n=1 Tax=Taibaiella lutea TaxID=2608001 RepID=A0A5M6CJS5_9BACT|nr:biotin--[acetyl-CoA-carboxylase] ligase [Taibaiella lutea]KAA5534690.1 biotin--[acetyl-CoA-carboxylase] ligase [Taibaiella lutea]
MAQNAETTFPAWLHHFDTIDSTNNYAMQLIDDGLAYHGQVIWADYQTKGKGQRGKTWENNAGSLLMSLIIKPEINADKQFTLSMQTAVTIAKYLQALSAQWHVAIKWPNDIYLNDKKTCGILIENVFRGMNWAYAVIGIGVNVNQKKFTEYLPTATSMSMISGQEYNLKEMLTDIRTGLLNLIRTTKTDNNNKLLNDYNNLLFRKGKEISFIERSNGRHFEAYVQEVNANGQLILLSHMGIEAYNFGSLDWILK